MGNKFCYILVVLLFFSFKTASQNQTEKDSIGLTIENANERQYKFSKVEELDPLRPAKAAFYSAIIPGLGQAYNQKYWKIPIVWGAIGTGIYFYIRNDNLFNDYRDAYKRRLAGFTDDEFFGRISDNGLIRAQNQFRRNRELSLLITVGLYALNILDANVDAHLLQFNVSEDLSLNPHFQYNQMENSTDLGLTFNFKF